MVLLVGGGAAVLLPDGHGREAADILILTLDDPQDPVLARNGGQRGVEIPCQGTQAFHVVPLLQFIHLCKLFTQAGDVLRRGVFNNVGQRQHLQGIADGVDLLHVLGRERVHDHAAAHHIFHQSVPLQLAERLPQGGPGNMKPVGIVGFNDPLARGDLPRDNGFLQHIVGDLTDRTAFHHRLKGQ